MSTSGTNINAVLELTRSELVTEIRTMLDMVAGDDLTIHEVVALAAVLRPAYERKTDDARPLGRVLTLAPTKGEE